MDETSIVIATSDPVCREVACRWAAAVGGQADVVESDGEVRRRWHQAAAIIVDAERGHRLTQLGVVRRTHVLVVDACEHPGENVWRTAVALGAEFVCRPDVPGESAAAVELLGAAIDGRGEACVVAVLGARGGVGASTLGVALSLRASRRWRSVLVDLDPVGGVDVMLGAEHAAGARWDTLDLSGGRLPSEALLDVLPRSGELAFLTTSRDGPPRESDPAPVLTAVRRAADLVVLDVPRCGPVTSAVSRAELTVLVVPDDVGGLAAARSLISGLRDAAGPVVAVRRCRPGGLGSTVMADHLQIPVIGRMRYRRGSARLGAADLRRLSERVQRLTGLVGSP